MAKADTVAAIKAANSVELDEAAYTQAYLDQLLPLAQKGEAGLAEFSTKKTEIDKAIADAKAEADRKAAEKAQGGTVADDSPKKTVRVNYANDNVAEGAGFIHPTSKTVITGDKTFIVPSDDWTDTMIRDKVLTEVRK